MDKKNFAFGKTNFIMLAVGMIVVILGFILMSSGGSTQDKFDPSIFDTMHITVAPMVCFVGFISIIFAVIYKPKDEDSNEIKETKK